MKREKSTNHGARISIIIGSILTFAIGVAVLLKDRVAATALVAPSFTPSEGGDGEFLSPRLEPKSSSPAPADKARSSITRASLSLNFSPETPEEKQALRRALLAALHEPGSESERMARVKPFIDAMNPENAFLMRDVFAASWDADNHFVAEHVLQWKKLGEIVGEEAAQRYVTPNGAWGYVYGNMLESWAAVAPDDAIAWMRDFPVSKNRNEVVAGIVKGVAKEDPQGAIELVAGLPDDEIGPTLATLNLAATLDYKGNGITDIWNSVAKLPVEDIHKMLLSLVDEKPETALEWASGVSNLGADVESVTAGIGAKWVKEDLKGLSVWLSSNPRHTMHDELALSLIQEIVAEDHEAAEAWLKTIEDVEIKQRAAALVK